MSATPETDAIEQAIPETAELREHWHKMDQHARDLETRLGIATKGWHEQREAREHEQTELAVCRIQLASQAALLALTQVTSSLLTEAANTIKK